jgi:hypothetical protein
MKLPLQGSQNARVLKLLLPGKWVPMYRILDLKPRVAKYTSRISDLRAMGWKIECKTEVLPKRVVASSYRLLNGSKTK